MPDSPGHIDKLPAIVAEQAIRTVAERGEEIEIAVAVVINPRRLTTDAGQGEANLSRHIDEALAIALVAVDLRSHLGIGEPDVEIGMAIGVVVSPGHARTRLVRRIARAADLGVRTSSERPAIIPIEPVGAAAKADEIVEVTVIVDIGPRVACCRQ